MSAERDPIPASPSPVPLIISFSAELPNGMFIGGQHIDGEMRNGTNVDSHHPEPDIVVHYQFFPDHMPEIPAGSLLTVKGVVDSRGWIDECCEYGPNGPVRLSELDLAGSPVLPYAPGRYFIELSVHIIGATGQSAPGDAPYTFLFPVRVVPAS